MIFSFDKTTFEITDTHVLLYDGIELSYVDIAAGASSYKHDAVGSVMQINYCRAGQVVWNIDHERSVFLNPGDFSVHTLDVCTDSSFIFPNGQYQGLVISVDMQKVSVHPPELLAETETFRGLLYEKFCRKREIALFSENKQSESIFSGFYGLPEKLALPCQRLKTLELFLYLAQIEMTENNCLTEYPTEMTDKNCLAEYPTEVADKSCLAEYPIEMADKNCLTEYPAEMTDKNCLTEYPLEQIEIVRKIHNTILQNMEQRITIEELSRQYLINPTTLKSAFKAVYGTSLAAHMKMHRMEQAAKLLRETDMSVAEVAAAVGYESQSKFAAAFKNQFAILPNAYRKHHK